MPPSEPKRALIAGTVTATPIALVSGILFALGDATATYGFWGLLVLPFVTGLTTACFVHAVSAILLTTILSGLAFAAVAWSAAGMDGLAGLPLFAPLMFGAAVVGAIVGLLCRGMIRRRLG